MSQLRMGSYDKCALVSIETITPLHVGAGRGLATVDLPIQRDGLSFPTIFSSSLRGPIRAAFKAKARDSNCTSVIFGPETDEGEYYAAAFAAIDAKLLLIPVRSLRGTYVLATSPALLKGLLDYVELAEPLTDAAQDLGKTLRALIAEADRLKPDRVMLSKESIASFNVSINDRSVLVLADEYRLNAQEYGQAGVSLVTRLSIQEPWRMSIIHDDLFPTLIERSLLRQARIRLQAGTKRVEGGGLWTEEQVPPHTVLCSLFLYSTPRAPNDVRKRCPILDKKGWNSQAVKETLEHTLLSGGIGYMIFGGDETTGRGVAKLRLVL